MNALTLASAGHSGITIGKEALIDISFKFAKQANNRHERLKNKTPGAQQPECID